MLALMKSLMNSVFGKIVVAVIVFGMAFWGVDQVFAQLRGGLGANLAQAGARSVDAADLDARVENVLRRMNATASEPISKEQALDQGIVDEVFAIEKARLTALGFAERVGVKTSPERVVATLRTMDAFKNPLTGELDMNTYREVLRQNGLSESAFEQQVADDLTLQGLQAAASGAVSAPQVLVGLDALYFGETRDASWFVFRPLADAAPYDPAAEELQAYYNDNLARLRQPERRSIDLVSLSAEDFMAGVQVTDQEIATIYEAAKSGRFSEPDQRTFAELYFASRDDARAAFGLLAGGADPSSVPGTVSTELRTGRADSVEDPLLREAMFGAGRQSGALFGPSERDGRWLVARLVSVQPGAVRPLETVADQIRTELALERAQVVFTEKLEVLETSISAGSDIDAIAAEIGVPVMSFAAVDSNGFTERGQRVMALINAQEAFTQAFAAGQGEITTQFEGGTAVYVASTRTIAPAATPSFETIRDDVKAALVSEKRQSEAQRIVTALTDKLKAGETTLAAEAEKAGASIDTLPQPISRVSAEQMGLPAPITNAIFRGRSGDAVSFPAGPDEVIILQIGNVTPPAPEVIAEIGGEVAAKLTGDLRTDLDAALNGEIERSIKLRTNEAALTAYKSTIRTPQ